MRAALLFVGVALIAAPARADLDATETEWYDA